MKKTRSTKANRCTLTQQSEQPLFPWRWLGWLDGSHLMRARKLIWRDGALKDSNIHSIYVLFVHSSIYALLFPSLYFTLFLERCTHLIKTEHGHSNTRLKLRCSCYDVHFSHLLLWREWVWNVNGIGTSSVWQRELCSRAVSLITTDIPNDGCSTLLPHHMSNFSPNSSLTQTWSFKHYLRVLPACLPFLEG